MIQAQQLKGTGVAVVTPFTKQEEIDFEALEIIIEHLIEGGVDYLVILGTTAETPTLSTKEQEAVARFVLTKTRGRVPLLIGVGGNHTRSVLERMKNAVFSQYDGVLIATPSYNKPSQEGIYQHYCAIAEQSKLPIILYNVPGRTGVNMTAETTLRLANRSNKIIAIKEASGDLLQINAIINQKPPHFDVLSGDDALTLPMISIGAIGVISVLANALPREMSALVKAANNNEYAKAQEVQKQLFGLSQAIFIEGNPTGIKAVMAEKGLLENVLRLPLVGATTSLRNQLKDLLF